MRVAETRAVIRALRTAYGVGICSRFCCRANSVSTTRAQAPAATCERKLRRKAPRSAWPNQSATTKSIPTCSGYCTNFARHHLLRFFLLPRQQAANKLRPFLSIVFDCPFSKELADLRNTPLFLIRYFFNLPFQFWMDSKCQEIFLRHPANIAGQLRQKQ